MRIQALFIKFAGQFVKQVTMRMKIRKKKNRREKTNLTVFAYHFLVV